MTRLLLADRVKGATDSFLKPLLPALQSAYDVRFLSAGPGEELRSAIDWADIVWLEWCWDHAVWATQQVLPEGKPCVLRLHSVEALQTDFPERVNWRRVSRLLTVGDDIAKLVISRFPSIGVPLHVIPNGIDLKRFPPGQPNRAHIGWVGHLEPKKNPMLLMQIADRLRRVDDRYRISIAGGFTDLRTARYLYQMQAALGLAGMVHFDGHVADMPTWFADKGILLSTSMYESFGMNIGEAMAVGAFPVIHNFPGAGSLWPHECLFAGIEEAVAKIVTAQPGLYRNWIADRYGLDRQIDSVLGLLAAL